MQPTNPTNFTMDFARVSVNLMYKRRATCSVIFFYKKKTKTESAVEFLRASKADVNTVLCMKTKAMYGHYEGHLKKHQLWAVFCNSGENKRKHLMFSHVNVTDFYS